MQVIYLDNSTSELLECSGTEIKVLLAMVKLAKNNIVDLQRKNSQLLKLLGVGDSKSTVNERSVANTITKLSKRGVLVKTGLPRVWFIDPSYFMKGYYQKVYAISGMIENKDRDLLGKIDEWEEEERKEKEKEALKYRWERKREEQIDFSKQVKVVDGHTDNTNRKVAGNE